MATDIHETSSEVLYQRGMLLKIYFILNTIQFYDSLAIYCVQLDVVFPHLEINGNGCSCIEFDTRQPKSIYTFNTKAI